MKKTTQTHGKAKTEVSEIRKAEKLFRLTEVQGRSKSNPIFRQGCISYG
jgi:hypothetical protein